MAVRSGNNPTYRGHHQQHHHQHATATTSPLPSPSKSGHHEQQQNQHHYNGFSSVTRPPHHQDDDVDDDDGEYQRRRSRRRRPPRRMEWFMRRVNMIIYWFSRSKRPYCLLLIIAAASLSIGIHVVKKFGRLLVLLLSSSSLSSSWKPRILIIDDTLQQRRQELPFAGGSKLRTNKNFVHNKMKKNNNNNNKNGTTTTEDDDKYYYDIFDVPYYGSLPFSDSKYERNHIQFDNSDEMKTNCTFVAPSWQAQTMAPPTCNVLHEIGMRLYIYHHQQSEEEIIITDQYRIFPLDSGGFKDVWYIINEEPRRRRQRGTTTSTDTTTTTKSSSTTTNTTTNEEQQSQEEVADINPDFVLKTTVYEHDHTLRELDKHRRDALVMEQATKSPYVLDMYGYCAFSNVVQAATGTLSEWRKMRFASDAPSSGHGTDNDNHDDGRTSSGNRKPRRSSEKVIAHSVQLLKLATQLARGISDMHLFHPTSPEHYNKDGSPLLLPTVAHADVKPSQFLLVRSSEGQYKFRINDFNRCRFLTWKNSTTTTTTTTTTSTTTTTGNPAICPFHMSNVHKGSTMRSPEEYTTHGPQSDKIDVYSLGSIIYYLLTGHSPFDNMEYKKAMKLLAIGTEPPLPKELEDSNDRAIQILIQVMRACRQFRPQERPYSYQIVAMLEDGLHNLKGHGNR